LENEIEILTPLEKIRDAAKECQTEYDELQKRTAKTKQLRSEVKQLGVSLVLSTVLAARSAALSVVPNPPSIVPTAGVKSNLLQLSKLLRKQSHVKKSADVLDALSSPPTISNTTLLTRSIQQLRSNGLKSVRFTKNLSILKPLKPLPALQNVDSLKSMIGDLSLAVQRKKALVAQSKRLAKIDEPPQLDSLQQLQTVIVALDEALLKHEQLSQLLASTRKDLDAAEQAFEAWIEEHPQCPTCGSELSAHALSCGSHSAEEANDGL